MAWYDEAVFYHIYPLGLTGAPKQNPYGEPEHRLNTLLPWITHIKNIGCNALYIGPLFESVGHGYETTDYRKLDSRLGTNEDLTAFVAQCHRQGIRVVLDGVFNHTGRDFFAFQDLKQNREHSAYKDWYCNVNFWGNNEYNDGFSYENWGGHNLLVKLNQHNPAVRDYICDVIRFWVSEFDIDGIRLDAADVLDFEYMKALRRTANEAKPDFWLMGEVIHGDYTRWVNEGTLHCVTNYTLHKALYSGHNDHNYFEIAHTVKRLYEMGGNRIDGLRLYNFTDNHDVERIYTKLNNKEHFVPAHILLYTLPGVPSIYYGSEFGIEGRKEHFSDDSLRPALSLSDYADALEKNPCTRLIAALGKVRQRTAALSYGDYKELLLTNRQYAFSRNHDGVSVVVTVNNDDSDYVMTLPAGNAAQYMGALSGEKVSVDNGRIVVNVKRNSGDIWVPVVEGQDYTPESQTEETGMEETPKAPATVQQNEVVQEKPAEASFKKTDLKTQTDETSAEKTADMQNKEAAAQATASQTVTASAEQSADIQAESMSDTQTRKASSESTENRQLKKAPADSRKSESTAEYWWKAPSAEADTEDPTTAPDSGIPAAKSTAASDVNADEVPPMVSSTNDADEILTTASNGNNADESLTTTSNANNTDESLTTASNAETSSETLTASSDAGNTGTVGEALAATNTAAEAPKAAVEAPNANSAPESLSKASNASSVAPASAEPDSEAFEKGRIAGLQEAILAIMEKNGPVTDQMRRDVMANIYHDSLINWVKSFR